jgi:hypothetical protein
VSYQTALQVAPKDWPHRRFVGDKLNKTLAEWQRGKSKIAPATPTPSLQE